MMYDELIKRLRETSVDFGESDHVSVMLIEAADAIEKLWELFRSAEKDNAKLTAWYVEKCNKHKWIPVTERLPEEDGKYLTVFTINTRPPRPVMEVCCYAKDLYKVDKYDFHDKKRKHGFYQYDSEWGFFEMSDISHWMPLPEPPKHGEE